MSALQPFPLTRTIHKDPDISLVLYIPPPETVVFGSKYTVNYTSTLYLQMNKSIPGEDIEQWKLRRFAIKPSNLFNVVYFFNEVVGWFQDPEKSDMFLTGANGNLLFNSKYDELSATTKKGYFDDHVMKAVPALVEVAQGKFSEGIYLFINRKSNMVVLTLDRVEAIFNVLRMFSFTNEVLLTIDLLRHSVNCGKMITQEQYNERRANPGGLKW